MIPLNAWGAVIIGLVASTGVDNALQVFIASIPYNFYAIVAISEPISSVKMMTRVSPASLNT